jgi:hypothetical protein
VVCGGEVDDGLQEFVLRAGEFDAEDAGAVAEAGHVAGEVEGVAGFEADGFEEAVA